MNVEGSAESPKNEFGSPFFSNDNGNDGQNILKCTKFEQNGSSNDPVYNNANGGYEVDYGTVPHNGLDMENTIDYMCKRIEDGDSKTNRAASLMDTKLEDQEGTVDYVNKESSQIKHSYCNMVQIYSHPDCTTNTTHSKSMHNAKATDLLMPYLQNAEQPAHYNQQLAGNGRTKPMRSFQLTVKQTDEPCGNVISEHVEIGVPYSKPKHELLTMSLFSMSGDVSDMCLRKNSLISSGSEKPMSASLLENSLAQNTSAEVFSGSFKWPNHISECQPGVQSGKDLNYCDISPQSKDSSEHVLINKGGEIPNPVSDRPLHAITCSTPETDNVPLHPDYIVSAINTEDDLNKNNMVLGPDTSREHIFPVLHIEENNLEAKEVDCAHVEGTSSVMCASRTPSSCSEAKEILNNLSDNCEDTFLIASPSLHPKAYTSTPLPESKNMTFSVPGMEDLAYTEITRKAELVKANTKGHVSASLKGGLGNGAIKPCNRKLTVVTCVTKAKKTELVSFPKPNFKNVKAKVLTRPGLMTKDCPSSVSKPSPQSPQTRSTASSPMASPRAPTSTVRMARKKPVLDQGTKAEMGIAKSHKQPINKQLFPSQPAHVPTHTKAAQGKVPRTAVLKQTSDEIERASSSNSTRSSGSAAALTCAASSKVTENKGDKAKPASKPVLNGVHMGPEKIEQNGHIDDPHEKSESQKNDCTSADIYDSVVPFSTKLTTSSKKFPKELLSCLKTATLQSGSTARVRVQPSDQRRGSLSKNVVTLRVSSPPRAKEHQNHATTGTSSVKTEDVPAKCTRPNGITGTLTAKSTYSRARSQSLKVTQTGTKKSPNLLNPGVTKPTGPSSFLTKRAESKTFTGVDKGKQKTSPRGPVTPTQSAPVDTQALELAQCKTVCEEQKGIIKKLRNLLTCSDQRFEALTVVIQHVINQRDDALKKHKELSQELLNIRGDLVSVSSTCEKLEKEKNDLLVAYESILQKVKDEHLAELSDLEEKLKQFYTGECEKLQSIFIEEAEKYKNELQEKVDDLNKTHESYRLAAEASHVENIENIKREYQDSLTELKNSQEKEHKVLQDSFKEKQEDLEKKIEELKQENESLKEKLKAEEDKRKQLKEKSVQKNPQVMYLEQELESLKAVLEIKNEKLHQQDKKLMQIEKLVETNTILVERLNKCQQENEDLKARMANHIALSRQLSNEQEVLQRSLEKESKANKRLSMENEELLWKLHNGDLCSPKKLSPSSPAIPFHSPRNSGSFPSPTVSPR